MELVDKQNYIALLANLLNGILQALFKFAAVLAARNHAAKIQRKDPLAGQGFRNFSGDDQLRQSFDDGALAHARLADKHGIVLGAAAHDLHDALDLGRAAHHGIQLAVLRGFGQIAAVFFQRVVVFAAGVAFLTGLAVFAVGLVVFQAFQNLLLQFLRIDAHISQKGNGHAFPLPKQRQPEMLGTYVAVAQTAAFQNAAFQNFFASGCQFQHAAALTGAFAKNGVDTFINCRIIDVFRQKLGNDIPRLFQQAQQQMLGAHVGLMKRDGGLLSRGDGPLGPLSESSKNRHRFPPVINGFRMLSAFPEAAGSGPAPREAPIASASRTA